MQEQIMDLDLKLNRIYVEYMAFQIENIKRIKELMSQMQQFALWFLNGNQFGIEEELYQGMVCDLSGILKDIVDAIECGDGVLLHDATAYGFSEYLRLFVSRQEEE